MKAALVRAVDDVEVVELPVPDIGEGEILVAMKSVGICGSDLSPWYVASKAPSVLGHEPAGVVESIGRGVTGFSPGDRVFVHHHASCGRCRTCLQGDAVMCSERKRQRLHPGGLAERVRVEKAAVDTDTLRLPDSLSFDDGALVEPVSCAVKALARADVRQGDTVAVIGLGSNGILLGLLARNAGAARLVGSDPDPARRALAPAFGFDRVVDPVDDLGTADVVFVLPTAESAVHAALRAAAPGGRVLFYSPVAPETVWRLSPHSAYLRDLTLRFSYSSGAAEIRRALELIEAGVVRAERLVTHRFPLEHAPEAFRTAASRGDALKVIVTVG